MPMRKFYPYSVWADGCVPRIKAHYRIGAKGSNEVYQEVGPQAANGHARWKLRACGPSVLGKGDARCC